MFVDIQAPPEGLARTYKGLYLVTSWIGPHSLSQSGEWYESQFEYPEYQGEAEQRIRRLIEENETETFIQTYGSCDSLEQFMRTELSRRIANSKHEFIVTFRELNAETDDGYRWHKNGEYIGEKSPQYEEFGRDDDIKVIFHFGVFRRK